MKSYTTDSLPWPMHEQNPTMINRTAFSLFLFVLLQLHCMAQSADKPLHWTLSITTGNTSYFPTTSANSTNMLIGTYPNPILQGPPRYFALGLETSLRKHVVVGLNTGYSALNGSVTVRDTSYSRGHDVVFKLNEAFFIEPYVSWEFFLDSSFSILPGVGVSLYYQELVVNQNSGIGDTRWRAQASSASNFYATINPKLEFRSKPYKQLQLGFIITYAQGLQKEVATVNGTVNDEASYLPYATSYNASHIMLAIRAGWTFP